VGVRLFVSVCEMFGALRSAGRLVGSGSVAVSRPLVQRSVVARMFSELSDDFKLGRVKWFDPQKGYGFIKNPDDGSDVFVHYSSILQEGDEFRTLQDDEEVEFAIVSDDQSGRPQARSVRRLQDQASKAASDEDVL